MHCFSLDSLLSPVAGAFAKDGFCRLKPLPFGAAALLALEMQKRLKKHVVLIAETSLLMEQMRHNLDVFAEDANDLIFDFPPFEGNAPDRESDPLREGQRLRTLAGLGIHAQKGHAQSVSTEASTATPDKARPPQELQKHFLINTCIQALMQRIAPPSTLASMSFSLSAGAELEPEKLAAWLEKCSYDFTGEVQEPGQAARRGGLLDVWPPADPYPLRIEFDGARIESIRSFDPVDQRSFAKKENFILLPASENIKSGSTVAGRGLSAIALATAGEAGMPGSTPSTSSGQAPPATRLAHGEENSSASLAKYLPPETIFFWAEKCLPGPGKASRNFGGFNYHADLFEKEAADTGRTAQTVSFRELAETISGKGHRQCFSLLLSSPTADSPLIDLGFEAVAETYGSMGVTECRCDGTANLDAPTRPHPDTPTPRHPDSPILPYSDTSLRRRRLAMLEAKAQHGMHIHVFFDTQGDLDRFRETCGRFPFKLRVGAVSDGFLHENLKFAVISEADFLREKLTARRPELYRSPSSIIQINRRTVRPEAGGITEWAGLEPGDLVVHANHGIGKYLGLNEIVFNGKLQEVFAIEYAGRSKLYVPTSHAHLLSRYFGAGSGRTKIHRLGGSQWNREKLSAENAIYELAASLLETQALRETLSGFAYPADAAWQHDFEAAFPYEETLDQEKAIADVKADMQATAPMDRLICGDAGYGKTEVAMRAAFKAVMAGKQVAVLVPTTVLALQHYEVFQARMADYPVIVELLCRFRSSPEQQAVVDAVKKGTVDVVIGTHRLLQPDMWFKDLGLIIIDEEQRFGVAHKEHLKHLKKLADVLTLTATPIPRTLYLSLTGARKISMIQTPPKNRISVETIIAKNDDRLARDAVLRELNRGGQVFYLHNRVATIDKALLWLKKIVPEAKIAVAHGQMASNELAATMRDFASGLFDVLLCTTIVESGVDLPNVNTIMIDRADRFGIADLYQLRGRVGRSDRKAYAYLLTPIHGYLLDIARRRLGAVVEHNQLGSGFKLAMLDLEIRGAGNLLGPEQSGHIAAIGFDLYCQSLKRAIEFLKTAGKATIQPAVRIDGDGTPPSRLSRPVVRPSPRGSTAAGHAGAGRAGAPVLSKAVGTPPPVIPSLKTSAVEVNLDFIDLSSKNKNPESAAFLPGEYVEDEESRVKVYRKISGAAAPDDIESLRSEFRDRFGPLPQAFERLLKIALIRVMAIGKKITSVESRDGKLMLRRANEYLQTKGKFPRLRASSADGRLEEIIGLLK